MRQPERIIRMTARALAQCISRSHSGWTDSRSSADAGTSAMEVSVVMRRLPAVTLPHIRRRPSLGYTGRKYHSALPFRCVTGAVHNHERHHPLQADQLLSADDRL